jgi:hypothetical protein
MSRDRSTPDTGTQSSASPETDPGRHADYVEPAPLGDILHEQLDYLVAHAAESCAPGCAECARLQQVQGWLLLPFRGNRRVRAPRRAA